MSASSGLHLQPDAYDGFCPPSSYVSSGKRNAVVPSPSHNNSRRGSLKHAHFQSEGQFMGTARHGTLPGFHPSAAPLSTCAPHQASSAQAQLLVQGDQRNGRSLEWMQMAMQLLNMCGRQDEVNAQIDDPSRAAFLGVLTSAPATYVAKDNAFVLPSSDEWCPIPEVIRQLFCTCKKVNCICTSAPPCGLFRDLSRLWVIDGSKLYLWCFPSANGDGEKLDVVVLDEAIESVTYVPLSRSLLPEILRSSFFFVEEYDDPCVVDIFSSNATSTPPCATPEDSALHCLVISTTTCVRVYAMANKESRGQSAVGGREGIGFDTRCVPSGDCGKDDQLVSSLPPESLCLSLVGMAKKPRTGLKLHVACAHKGTGCVFLGDSTEGMVYVLTFSPTTDCANASHIISKRLRAGFGNAHRSSECSGGWLHGCAHSSVADPGDIAYSLGCKLIPLNRSFSSWILGSMSRVVRSLRKDQSFDPEGRVTRKGILQIEADESRGIVWALSGESDVTAFVLPTPVIDPSNPLYMPLDVRNIKACKCIWVEWRLCQTSTCMIGACRKLFLFFSSTVALLYYVARIDYFDSILCSATLVRMTRREIEDRLSSLVPDWARSPREGDGGLLGLLAGGGQLKGVRICPTAPHEARAVVAVLVDSLGKSREGLFGVPVLFRKLQTVNP